MSNLMNALSIPTYSYNMLCEKKDLYYSVDFKNMDAYCSIANSQKSTNHFCHIKVLKVYLELRTAMRNKPFK